LYIGRGIGRERKTRTYRVKKKQPILQKRDPPRGEGKRERSARDAAKGEGGGFPTLLPLEGNNTGIPGEKKKKATVIAQ